MWYCHLPALRRIRGAVVVAVADTDPSALAAARAATGAEAFTDLELVLGHPDVDAVLIALPSHRHADAAVRAAAAGKHLYLEKPVATNATDASRVSGAVERAGVIAVTGFNRRMHPCYRRARALLRSGAIGTVRLVHSVFCEPAPPAGLPGWKRARSSGGGALLDLGSHHVDLLRWFLDDEVARVAARVESRHTEGDTAMVSIDMARGAVVQGYYALSGGMADHLEVSGDGGSLRVDRHGARLRLRVRRRGYGLRTRFTGPWTGLARRLVRPSEDPSYFHALRAFVDSARGERSELASIADGVRSLEVVLAAEDAARRGEPVTLAVP